MDDELEQSLAKRFPIYESNKGELANDMLLNTVDFDCAPMLCTDAVQQSARLCGA